jgi:hypothetical protein
MEVLTPQVAAAWYEFIGWADFEVMRKAALVYVSENKFKPAPSQLKAVYMRVFRNEEERDRKYADPGCKFCRGNGWTMVFDPANSERCGAFPCGCCSPPKQKKQDRPYASFDKISNHQNWKWDDSLLRFVPNDEWFSDNRFPPPSKKDLDAVRDLFADKPVLPAGLNWDTEYFDIDYEVY